MIVPQAVTTHAPQNRAVPSNQLPVTSPTKSKRKKNVLPTVFPMQLENDVAPDLSVGLKFCTSHFPNVIGGTVAHLE
jgi:hypothetical protein